MMLAVPDHLGFCVEPSGAMFLDIRRARYFGLPSDLEEPFSGLVRSEFQSAPDETFVNRLLALGVIEYVGKAKARTVIGPTQSSFMDLSRIRSSSLGLGSVPAVMSAVLRARTVLRHRTLSEIVQALTRSSRTIVDPAALLARTAEFQASRPWIPIKPVCLLDSLALRLYLSRYRLKPSLVFGVVRRPFFTHCWLQHDGMVLNDRLDRVRRHTPILVVP